MAWRAAAQSEFAYYDENQGQLTGYDIELSRWLAARMMPTMPEVRPVFIGYTWNRLLETVHRNEVDFIISTITITPQREEEYGLRFSKPYYSTRQACVVCEKGTIHTATDLHNRRIAVQAGTSSEPVGEAFTESTNLMRVPSTEVAFEKLVGGQIDAVITDYDFAQKEVRRLSRPCRVIPLEASDYPQDYRGMRVDQYGIAVAKPETDLLERINNALDAAKRQNVLQTLKSRYVNRDISFVRVLQRAQSREPLLALLCGRWAHWPAFHPDAVFAPGAVPDTRVEGSVAFNWAVRSARRVEGLAARLRRQLRRFVHLEFLRSQAPDVHADLMAAWSPDLDDALLPAYEHVMAARPWGPRYEALWRYVIGESAVWESAQRVGLGTLDPRATHDAFTLLRETYRVVAAADQEGGGS